MEVPVSQEQLEMCRTFCSLSRRLHQPSNDLGIAVLTGARAKELVDIVSLRDHLSDIRIMLILPDRERDTSSEADSLGPRFLAYVDNDFEEVKAVLSKLLKNLKPSETKGRRVI